MEDSQMKGMTLVVKTVTRLTLGFILLYGIYIALNGRIGPGGGFAGGIIVALSFIHIMLAFGKEVAMKRLRIGVSYLTVSLAALLFLCFVVMSFGGRIAPMYNEIAMPLCEAAMVGGGIFTIIATLLLLTKDRKDPE